MREIQRNKQRKRKKKGCGSCLGKGIVFIIVFSLLGAGGYKLFTNMGIKNRILQSQYPIKYQEFVERYSSEFGLEPALVYAVIRTESKFDPYAVSVTMAKGLMQIQDETGLDCAKVLQIKDYTTDLLFDPQTNIKIGCYYLKKLMGIYDNNVRNAVAAYNAGLGNVDKWLKTDEYINKDGELVNIPFPETKNYVDGVVKAQRIYRELYFITEK